MSARSRTITSPTGHGPSDFQMPTRETHRLIQVLARERSRIDRCGGMLALVVFYIPKPWWGTQRRLRRLLEVLKQRLRITDEVGQIDGQRAFALLPDTDPIGAEVLARQIQHRLTDEGLRFSFAVFRYVSGRLQPADTRDADDDHGHHNGHGNGSANGHGDRASRHTLGDRKNDHTLPVRVVKSDGRTVTVTPPEPEACIVNNFPEQLPWWKRGVDLIVGSTALVLASPVLLATAAAIKLESPGPVLFTQLRAGAGRRPFRIFKFRTMVDGAEEQRDELLPQNEQDGPAFKIRQDPRITRVGRFLRATSIDELPQLLNVLRGEMTLVGPRPLPVHEADGCASWQDARHNVHPGLTCIWQVNGRSRVSFEDWARMDLRYIRRRSLWQDLKILLATVPAVLRRDGAC